MKQSISLIIASLLFGVSSLRSFKVYKYDHSVMIAENCDPRVNGEYLVLDNLLKNNSIVFDVGANIGDYTCFLLSQNKDTQIYSFEPIQDVFNILQDNLKMATGNVKKLENTFNLKNNTVFTFNFGFYKNNTILPIWYAYSHNGLSSIYDRSKQKIIQKIGVLYKKLDIQLKAIDAFCLDQKIAHIDFLKIDTEGAEYDVLLGAAHMLAGKRIEKIQFEYGGCYLDAGYTLKQVYDYMTGYGYFMYKISPDGLVCIDKWYDELEDYKYSNFLATSRSVE